MMMKAELIIRKFMLWLMVLDLSIITQSFFVADIWHGLVTIVKYSFFLLVAYVVIYLCIIRPLRKRARKQWTATLPDGERQQIGSMPAYYYPATHTLYYADTDWGKFTPHEISDIVIDNDAELTENYHLLYNRETAKFRSFEMNTSVTTSSKRIELGEPEAAFEGHDGRDVRYAETPDLCKMICESIGKELVFNKDPHQWKIDVKRQVLPYIGDPDETVYVSLGGDIVNSFTEESLKKGRCMDYTYYKDLLIEIYTDKQKFRVFLRDRSYKCDGKFGELKVECIHNPKTESYTHNKYKGKTEESHIIEEMFDIKPRTHTTTYHYERETVSYISKWINTINLVIGDVRLDGIKKWKSSSEPKANQQDHERGLSTLAYAINPKK